jgi:hypothetical protein
MVTCNCWVTVAKIKSDTQRLGKIGRKTGWKTAQPKSLVVLVPARHFHALIRA